MRAICRSLALNRHCAPDDDKTRNHYLKYAKLVTVFSLFPTAQLTGENERRACRHDNAQSSFPPQKIPNLIEL